MEHQQNEPLPVELSSQLIAIMTTEHYNLQTGRSMTISEANGRSSLFVGAVSSGLVALAFVGQLSHLGTAFFVFSFVVLPTLLQPYFILSAHDDREGTLGHEAMQTSWVQVFLSAASMIAVINSVLVGSFVGLLLAVFTLPLWVGASAGVLVFLVSLGLHQRYQWEQGLRMERSLPVLFPSQAD